MVSITYTLFHTPGPIPVHTLFDKQQHKDADFLYDTIETYIKDAQKSNKSELVEIWQTIKNDRKRHMHMFKDALEKEIHR